MDILNRLDKSYLVNDPRLISAGHSGQRLVLSDPALNGKVCSDDIATGFYDGYAAIRAGNVEYYLDEDTAKPFVSYAGLFHPDTYVVYEDYVDPNGIRKPHYYLRRVDRCARTKYDGRLSFITDTNAVRADLLASNLWRRNQQTRFKFPLGN
jgi:hypothetical protein